MQKILLALVIGITVGAFGVFWVVKEMPEQGALPIASALDVGTETQSAQDSVVNQHRNENYQQIASVEDALALPSLFAQREALYSLAGRSDSAKVQSLIAESVRISSTVDRRNVQSILLEKLTELDPWSALAISRSHPLSRSREPRRTVWMTWGRIDFDAALEAAGTLTDPSEINIAAQALMALHGYSGNERTALVEEVLNTRASFESQIEYIALLAETSIEEAIAYIESLEFSRNVHELAEFLGTQIGSRLEHTDLFTNRRLASQFEYGVMQREILANPEQVIIESLGNPGHEANYSTLHLAAQELVERDFGSLMLYFDQATSQQHKRIIGSVVVSYLAKTDIDAAIRFAEENGGSRFNNLTMNLVSTVLQNDPVKALEVAGNIAHADRRRQAVSMALQTIIHDDPAVATAYIESVQSRQERNQLAQNIVLNWMHSDPEKAIDWVIGNETIDQGTVLSNPGLSYNSLDPEVAMRFLPRLDSEVAATWRQGIATKFAEQRRYSEALQFIEQFRGTEEEYELRASLVQGAAVNDIGFARQLVDGLPDGRQKDVALMALISEQANTDPRAAIDLLSTIGDQSVRGNAASTVAQAWYRKSPGEAVSWAQGLPEGSTRDDAISGMVGNADWNDSETKKLVELISDPEKKSRVLLSRVWYLSRTNRAAAVKLLDSSELTDRDRQRAARALQ